MRYKKINPQLFKKNRQRFITAILPDSIAIFNSNDEMPRNGDQNFSFRQQSDLFYLSGIDQEQTILIIFPDCPIKKYREILFIRKTSKQLATWEGPKYSIDEATAISGIKTVLWIENYTALLAELMTYAKNVYLNSNENIKFTSDVPYRDIRYAEELKKLFPLHQYKRSAPIMSKIRVIKSDIEIDIIKKACNITGKAFERILKKVRPGMMEYEIQAEIDHEFIRNGANGHAYQPIIASGENACILHYIKNNKECKDGELILMDFGCEYANYSSDLSRTIPVNGRFTSRQKAVYNSVLSVLKASTKMMVPGKTIEKIHDETSKLLEKEMIKLGLLNQSEIKNQDPDQPVYKKYFPHGTSHFIGLDVHDLGSKMEVFKPGMILSCEPALYIPEEVFGIRIENDILITKDGPVNLMQDIPIEIEEIEKMMNNCPPLTMI
ncbi:aminopeptidase P family protein [candidate division KSB1 bacterium]